MNFWSYFIKLFGNIMDFFGEGFQEQAGIKFTAQQQAFFQNKLPFLDPNNTQKIQLGQAISLMRFSGLPPNTQKKIFDNLKLTNKGTLDYMDMKKILRGVSLAQNRIQPSLININANIKTKLPVFHDDDSDEEEPAPPSKPVQPEKPPVKQPQPDNIPPNRPPPPQNRPPPAKVSNPTENPRQHQNDQIKKFEDFWQTLTLEHHDRISGNQVKKLFGNANNRSALSKIWKLCNTTHKGHLTKGELYIFVMLIKLKSGDIPPKLTGQMKDIIQKIDDVAVKDQKSKANNSNFNNNFFDETQNVSQNVPKTQHNVEQKKQIKIRKNSSVQFDNFADFGAFANKKETTNSQSQSQSQSKPPVPPASTHQNLRISTTSFQNTSNIKSPKFLQIPVELQQKQPEVYKMNQNIPEQIYSKLVNQLKSIQTHLYPKIEQLSNSNRQSNTILEQTSSLINSFQQANQSLSNRLAELKRNQDNMNYRLNQTCIRMRDVIVKQSDFIAELLQYINQEGSMNNQRVQVLQNYAGQATQQIDDTVNNFRQNQRTKQNISHQQGYPVYEETRNQTKQNKYNESSSHELNGQSSKYDQSYRRSLESMKEMSMSMSVSNKRKQQMSSIEESVDTRKVREMYGAQNYRQELRQKLKNNQMMETPVYTENDEQSQKQQELQRNFNKGAYHAEVHKKPQIQHHQQQNLKMKRTDSIEQKQSTNNNGAKNQPVKAEKHSQRQEPQHVEEQDSALRLKKKQIFTIQLINYLAPIREQQYPIILQRVTSMTQNQLDVLYAQLYKKYQTKMQEERIQQSNINPPTHDEFSSNNFRKYDVSEAKIHQNQSNHQQVDFFEQ